MEYRSALITIFSLTAWAISIPETLANSASSNSTSATSWRISPGICHRPGRPHPDDLCSSGTGPSVPPPRPPGPWPRSGHCETAASPVGRKLGDRVLDVLQRRIVVAFSGHDPLPFSSRSAARHDVHGHGHPVVSPTEDDALDRADVVVIAAPGQRCGGVGDLVVRRVEVDPAEPGTEENSARRAKRRRRQAGLARRRCHSPGSR